MKYRIDIRRKQHLDQGYPALVGRQGTDRRFIRSTMSYFNYNGKQIFYTEMGEGEPCIFLHGNTASSKMFEFILPLYTDSIRAVLIDFLGNGKSDRVSKFPDELWIDQGHQIVELCKVLNLGKVNLIGTSGGAYAAINAALEMPELFHKVAADSFDGSVLPEGFADAIIRERQFAKNDEQSRGFYEWCQGGDWEAVVDLDTEVLVNYERNQTRIFRSPIETIQVPLFITVSREDEMLANDMDAECRCLHDLNPNISYKIYDTGAHPLIASRAEEIAQAVKGFLGEYKI